MNTMAKEPVRQATHADIPRLVEMTDVTFCESQGLDGPQEIEDYFLSVLQSQGVVVFISNSGFWIGFCVVDATYNDRITASVFPHAVETDFWAQAAWTAEAWAESINAHELRISIPFKDADPMKFYTALGFKGQSVLLSRPIALGDTTTKDIEQ